MKGRDSKIRTPEDDMEKLKKKVVIGLVAFLLASASWLLGGTQKLGSASPGLATSVASSSLVSVGPTENLVIANNNPNCTSRVITTGVSNVLLSFATSTAAATTSLSVTNGHLQLASTTIAYDGGIYGCGYVGAFAFSSTSIKISEFR